MKKLSPSTKRWILLVIALIVVALILYLIYKIFTQVEDALTAADSQIDNVDNLLKSGCELILDNKIPGLEVPQQSIDYCRRLYE